jgi:ABC-type polysaccharide/polyol phosphate export permease
MTGQTADAITPPRRRATGRGPISLVRTGVGEILERRRLTRYLVGAELKRTHADTAFGQLWWIFDPLLQMAVYYIFVTIIFDKPTPDYPLFIFAAILPWKWFSTTLNEATVSITARQSLIRQVQFPKLVLPTSAVAAGTVSFVFGLVALAIVYLFYLGRLSPWVLAIPVIGGVQFVFTLAMGILFGALNAFFRDIQNVLRHGLRMWFYLSPALYSLDKLTAAHPTLGAIMAFNPMSILFTSYRSVTYGTSAPDWFGLLGLLGFSVVLLLVAVYVFKRAEPAFARIL